jgi:murein DD-endopeptidase MepM/ murein hydrolase activator NlpD
MTFGIDIASPQAGIDLVRAKSEGVQFVIVKMGGLNVTPQYVAPYYKAQIDKAIAAGLPKGHYYLIGKVQTPEEQAEFFVKNLHGFDPLRDVLALDNEALDSNGTRWGDADAARFIRKVLELTDLPPHRFWHYAGASDYRATGAWPELVSLGIRFWWASYGKYPTKQTPDHEPSLQGSIPRYDVHQFTSKSRVAGYDLDGNFSPVSVVELFGGGTVPLNNYVLRSPSVVILADNRDPYVSWQNHLARTSGLRGGVDIVAAVGTPVYARTAGVMLQVPNDGSAGNSCRFHHDANPGWYDVFSHLSRYVGASGQHFNAGDIVAYSGNSGNVDQHLHWHLVDPSGARRNPWDYFSGSSTAGSGGTPIEEPKRKRPTMFLLHCSMWGDWLIVPGVSARKVGNEDATNILVAAGAVQRVEISNENWNAVFSEAAGFAGIDLAGPEGHTWVNPDLR